MADQWPHCMCKSCMRAAGLDFTELPTIKQPGLTLHTCWLLSCHSSRVKWSCLFRYQFSKKWLLFSIATWSWILIMYFNFSFRVYSQVVSLTVNLEKFKVQSLFAKECRRFQRNSSRTCWGQPGCSYSTCPACWTWRMNWSPTFPCSRRSWPTLDIYRISIYVRWYVDNFF